MNSLIEVYALLPFRPWSFLWMMSYSHIIFAVYWLHRIAVLIYNRNNIHISMYFYLVLYDAYMFSKRNGKIRVWNILFSLIFVSKNIPFFTEIVTQEIDLYRYLYIFVHFCQNFSVKNRFFLEKTKWEREILRGIFDKKLP